MTTKFFLGFDPGGEGASKTKGNFGWSICEEVGEELKRLKTGLPKNAWEAVEQVDGVIKHRTNVRVLAAGIDAPLRWNGRGSRCADYKLRDALVQANFPRDTVHGTVQLVNSLRGACLVQGSLLVEHLSKKSWGRDLVITESHPKALEHLLTNTEALQPLYQMVRCLTKDLAIAKGKNHERDATLCAVSAWASIRKRSSPIWKNLYEEDRGLIYPSGISAAYWMPIPD